MEESFPTITAFISLLACLSSWMCPAMGLLSRELTAFMGCRGSLLCVFSDVKQGYTAWEKSPRIRCIDRASLLCGFSDA